MERPKYKPEHVTFPISENGVDQEMVIRSYQVVSQIDTEDEYGFSCETPLLLVPREYDDEIAELERSILSEYNKALRLSGEPQTDLFDFLKTLQSLSYELQIDPKFKPALKKRHGPLYETLDEKELAWYMHIAAKVRDPGNVFLTRYKHMSDRVNSLTLFVRNDSGVWNSFTEDTDKGRFLRELLLENFNLVLNTYLAFVNDRTGKEEIKVPVLLSMETEDFFESSPDPISMAILLELEKMVKERIPQISRFNYKFYPGDYRSVEARAVYETLSHDKLLL